MDDGGKDSLLECIALLEVCKLAIRVQAVVLRGKLEHIITGNSMLAFGA